MAVKGEIREKRLGGHRYWRFSPDPLLLLKHHNPKRIGAIQKKLLERRPAEGEELDHRGRDRIHPLLRERLPVGSRRHDFERVAEQLEYAKRLSASGIKGPHYYPAVIDTSMLVKKHSPEDIFTMRVFMDVPGHERRLIMPVLYVNPRGKGRYLIESFGMQRSDMDPSKKVHTGYHELRSDVPRGLLRTFDIGAPALSLALGSALMRKSGAERIILPGHVLQWWRRGTRRPQAKNALERYSRSTYYGKETKKILDEILKDWDKLGGVGIRNKLKEINRRGGPFFIDIYGIPKVLLNRNYRRVPHLLGARPMKLRDALGEEIGTHMKGFWEIPEEHIPRLLDERVFDLNIPHLESLYPMLRPMTKKEVSEWKEKMAKRGHDIEKISSMP